VDAAHGWKGHTTNVFSVAWSPDGTHIASDSVDSTLKVWNAAMGQEVLSLTGQTARVSSVAYSSDGKRISGKDVIGKVLTWDTTTGQLLPNASPVPMRGQTEAISPDGSRHAIIDNGQIKVVLIEEHKRQQARDRAFLTRLARPAPAYHRQRADQYEKSGDLFAAAFQLRRLLLIEAKEDVRKRLATVESKLAEKAATDAKLPQKPPAKMPYAD
jgi:WD40 repeat protein